MSRPWKLIMFLEPSKIDANVYHTSPLFAGRFVVVKACIIMKYFRKINMRECCCFGQGNIFVNSHMTTFIHFTSIITHIFSFHCLLSFKSRIFSSVKTLFIPHVVILRYMFKFCNEEKKIYWLNTLFSLLCYLFEILWHEINFLGDSPILLPLSKI